MNGNCHHCCPQGHPCACKAVGHTLHVCGDEACSCHQQERYRTEAARVAYVRTTYRSGGIRVVLDRGAPGGVGWIEVDRYSERADSA